VVRFQLWGSAPGAADAAMTGLQGRLLAASRDLWDVGVRALDGVAGTSAAEARGAWARTADYQVLFEYHLAPAADAGSLIAAIPVAADQEVAGSTVRETTTVTGDGVRWDQLSAPALVVRGACVVNRLAVASFLGAGTPPTGAVRVLRTNDDATGPPAAFATLPAFLQAMADPVAARRGGLLTFASLANFVAAAAPNDALLLGDWDGDNVPDDYRVGDIVMEPPLTLPTGRDRLEISVETAPLDHVAVVYLRATRA
jgi:hypothetical protein